MQEIFHGRLGGRHALEQLSAGNLPAILDGEPGVSSLLELVLFIIGTASSLAAFSLLVWKVVKPHVVAFMDGRIQAVQGQVQHVSYQVDQLPSQVGSDEIVEAIRDVRQQVGRVHRRMDKQQEQHAHTHQVLLAHVDESSAYLERATELLAVQGVKLPPFGRAAITERESDRGQET